MSPRSYNKAAAPLLAAHLTPRCLLERRLFGQGISFQLRLRMAFGVLSLLVALIAALALASLIRLRASAADAADEALLSRLASDVAVQALQCRRYEKDFFLNAGNLEAQDAPLQSWHAASIALRRAIKAFEDAAVDEDDRAAGAAWREQWVVYVRNVGQIEIAINTGEVKNPQDALIAFQPYHDNIHSLTDDAVRLAEAKNAVAQQTSLDLDASSASMIWIVAGIAAFVLANAVAAALAFPLWLSRPLKRLGETARRLAGGDLAARTGLVDGDEFGVLGQGLDHMAERVEQSTADLAAQYRQAEQARAQAEEASVVLGEQLATIRSQQEMISELSVPLLPLNDWTLVLPLVGAIDSARIDEAQDRALQAVQRSSARFLILDITGVPVVDTQVARGLLQIVQAARLLGCTTVLAGTRPEVAQTIVGLGIDLSSIVTLASLQSSVAYTSRQSALSRSSTPKGNLL